MDANTCIGIQTTCMWSQPYTVVKESSCCVRWGFSLTVLGRQALLGLGLTQLKNRHRE